MDTEQKNQKKLDRNSEFSKLKQLKKETGASSNPVVKEIKLSFFQPILCGVAVFIIGIIFYGAFLTAHSSKNGEISHNLTQQEASNNSDNSNSSENNNEENAHVDKAKPPNTPQPLNSEQDSAPAVAGSIPTGFVAKPFAKVNCKVKKCVALSFDDGPAKYSKKFVDYLKKKSIPATFFYIGYMANARKNSVKHAYNNGFEIGNHSWSHIDLSKAKSSQILYQVNKTNKLLKKLTGVKPILMRPPYGSTNKKVSNILKSQKLAEILWTLDTNDWRYRNTKKICNFIKKHAKRNSVILMHELYKTSFEATKKIIPILEKKGFTFAKISEVIGGPKKIKYGKIYF